MPADIIAAAEAYAARGWQAIPLHPRTKKPVGERWPDQRLTAAEIPARFGHDENVGVLLGPVSGGLTDIDLDCPEAREVAPLFLPATGAIFGRPSEPRSHYLYIVTDPIDYVEFKEKNGAVPLELRGGTGNRQTVFPPSRYKDFPHEILAWNESGEPASVAAVDLERAVRRLAAAVLIGRAWPAAGSRNEASLALAGALLHSGFDESDAVDFIAAVTQIGRDEEDRRAAVSATALRLADGEVTTGWPKLTELVNAIAVTTALRWLKVEKPEKSAKERPASKFVKLVQRGNELFFDENDEAYMTVAGGGTYRISSSRFKDWFIGTTYAETGEVPTETSFKESLTLLRAVALNGKCLAVHNRIGQADGKIYVDLGDPTWRAVEIDSTGWRIVDTSPIKFVRGKGQLALPEPVTGGDLTELRSFVNVTDDAQLSLLLGYLVGACWPTGPYPLLVLNGEAGSAKSTTARVLQALLDPSYIELRATPTDPRDVAIAAKGAHLLSFDNLSHVSGWLADALAMLATGGGYATRTLYANDEETILRTYKPVILNGITNLLTRGDLTDRAITLLLPRIDPTERRTEREFKVAFDEARPRIMGALYSALSVAISDLDNVVLTEKPRMADFITRVVAAGVLNFQDAFTANQRRADAVVLESSVIIEPLLSLLRTRSFTGTAAQLLALLGERAAAGAVRSRGWPTDAARLAGQLRRLAPQFLREYGVELLQKRSNGVTRYVLPQVEAVVQESETPEVVEVSY